MNQKSFLVNTARCLKNCSRFYLNSRGSFIKSRNMSLDSSQSRPSGDGVAFKPEKVVVMSKITRYELEKHKYGGIQDEALRKELQMIGSDFDNISSLHRYHKQKAQAVVDELNKRNIQTKLVDRLSYSEEIVKWSDLVITCGGDGTFLVGARMVKDPNKPIIGINTDPAHSEGHLLLPADLSQNVSLALDKLEKGDFKWKYRSRIRTKICGPCEESLKPIELHDEQLEPTFVHNDNHREDWAMEKWKSSTANISSSFCEGEFCKKCKDIPDIALNEVYFGESHAARVSYYEIAVDGEVSVKQKSSGLLIGTGTGSTSWISSANKLSHQAAHELLEILNTKFSANVPRDEATIESIIKEYNDCLLLDPSDSRMVYTIRNPLYNNTYLYSKPRGLINQMKVRSRCFDGCLVMDGTHCYKVHEGTQAVFSIKEEDRLKTVEMW